MIIEGEECKFIEGTDEFYAVSVTGKVWSFVKRTKNGIKRVSVPKILTSVLRPDGYTQVRLGSKEGRNGHLVHRLVAKAFIPNPNNLPCVNHKNEIKTDNRVENLEWCTYEYNINYGTRNARVSGNNHPLYVFVCPIKLAYLRNVKKMTQEEIAKEFNVTHGTIRNKLKAIGLR